MSIIITICSTCSERLICEHNYNKSTAEVTDRCLIEFSNHMQWLTEFVLTISDSRINLIIQVNQWRFSMKKVAYFIANYFRQCLIFCTKFSEMSQFAKMAIASANPV